MIDLSARREEREAEMREAVEELRCALRGLSPEELLDVQRLLYPERVARRMAALRKLQRQRLRLIDP